MLTKGHGDRSQLHYAPSFADPEAGSGEVVLRVAATAVNFHDIFTRRGMPGIKIPMPVIVGSDMAGEVHRIGSGVTEVAVGDRVLVDPLIISGERAGGMLGETAHGGRAEYLLVRVDQLVPVPAGVSLESAAALPLAYGTAHRMMVGRGKVQAGEKVLILGASGGVGVACVQLALLAGAEVIACASTPAKLERLKALGAHHVLDYTLENLVEGVRRLYGKPRTLGGGGVDVAVNFTGGDTWAATQKCVTLGGRILTCGATAGFDAHTDLRYLWTFEHSMVGSNGWSRSDLVRLLDLCATGKLHPVIDRVLPLHECAEAERLLEDREVFGKILIRP
jgi:alcohol dehydrogenase